MTDNLLASSSHPSRLLLVTQKPIFLALPVNLSGLRQPGLCEANIPGVVFFFHSCSVSWRASAGGKVVPQGPWKWNLVRKKRIIYRVQ